MSLLNALEFDEKVFGAYMLVRGAFNGEEEKAVETYIRTVGWNEGEYNKLETIARKIKECVSGYSEEEIYRYFCYLLPNQPQLSIYIARCICDAG